MYTLLIFLYRFRNPPLFFSIREPRKILRTGSIVTYAPVASKNGKGFAVIRTWWVERIWERLMSHLVNCIFIKFYKFNGGMKRLELIEICN